MQPNLRTIRMRRLSIARMLETLQAEDAELAHVEEVLARLASGSSGSQETGRSAKTAGVGKRGRVNGNAKRGPGRKSNGAMSQRELILAALQASSEPWMKVQQIISAVKARHGVAMPARSISPLLSNMKKTKQIVRKGRLVALPARASKRAA